MVGPNHLIQPLSLPQHLSLVNNKTKTNFLKAQYVENNEPVQ